MMATKQKVHGSPFMRNGTDKRIIVTLQYRDSRETVDHILEPGESVCVIRDDIEDRPHIRCRIVVEGQGNDDARIH